MVRFHSASVYYSFERFITLPILSFLTPDSNMMTRAATEMDYTYFPLSLPKETRHRHLVQGREIRLSHLLFNVSPNPEKGRCIRAVQNEP